MYSLHLFCISSTVTGFLNSAQVGKTLKEGKQGSSTKKEKKIEQKKREGNPPIISFTLSIDPVSEWRHH